MELTTSSMPDCDPCGKSKSKQHYSRVQQTPPLTALGRVHIDLIGPLTIQGVEGEKYISVKTAGKSRRQWVATSDSKAVLGLEVITWCRQMKAQGATITEIFCDNAKELIQVRNREYFDSEGIKLITSPPYDASRNGIAERANGITEDRIRASMIASGLPMRIWPYCARYLARLHNLISNSTLPGKITPMESWNRDIVRRWCYYRGSYCKATEVEERTGRRLVLRRIATLGSHLVRTINIHAAKSLLA
jgi:hypothetical protein